MTNDKKLDEFGLPNFSSETKETINVVMKLWEQNKLAKICQQLDRIERRLVNVEDTLANMNIKEERVKNVKQKTTK